MKNILFFLLPIAVVAQYGTGLEFDDEGYSNVPLKPRNVAYQDVITDLASVSLKEFVPYIENQGNSGTCVGWSTAYYAQTISLAKDFNLTNKEEITEMAFSPLYLYRNAKKDEDTSCKTGLGIPTALVTMKDKGSLRYNKFPYKCAGRIPDSLHAQIEDFKLVEYRKLFGIMEDMPTRVRQTKKSLAEGRPVVMGMRVQNSFQSAKMIYEPDTLKPYGNHAMTVIGYDDTKGINGAFEVVNSWGENWGNNGFMWIRYEDYAKAVHYGFELIFEKVPKPDVITKHNLSARLDLISYGFPFEVNQKNRESSGLGYQTTVYEDAGAGVADYITSKKHNIGTRYTVKASINKPAYVYVLGADVKRPPNRLFPVNDSISAYVSSDNATVSIPGLMGDRVGSFELNTNDVESDYTIALISLNKINIDTLIEQVASLKGPVIDRFYEVLKNDLIAKEDMELMPDTMGFNAEFEKGTVAMLTLDIRRNDYKEVSDE